MASNPTEFPSGPTSNSSPDIPSEFSSVPSTVSSGFNAALNAQRSGLSTGAAVGIGIGAAVAGLIIIGLIILLWKKKQRRDRTKSPNSEEEATVPDGVSPGNVGPANNTRNKTGPNEIDGEAIYEVKGAEVPQKPFEADHTHTRAELDSGWRGWEASPTVETDRSRQVGDTGAGQATVWNRDQQRRDAEWQASRKD